MRDFGEIAHVAEVTGHTHAFALGQFGLAPTGHLADRFEHADHPPSAVEAWGRAHHRLVAQQLDLEGQWVGVGGVRQLVDERLHGKGQAVGAGCP